MKTIARPLLLLTALAACKTPAPVASLKDDTPPSIPSAPGEGSVDRRPPGYLPKEANFNLWKQYCKGTENPADEVQPNYENADVQKAAKILSTVKKSSYKLYGDILKLHKTQVPPSVGDVTPDAHDFLTYLCGEFRDRAPMVKAKLDWVFNIRYLAPGTGAADRSCADRNDPLQGDVAVGSLPAVTAFDRNLSPWLQMCTEDYDRYHNLTRNVFDARAAALAGTTKIGAVQGIERAVPGFTICETKYQFAAYVKKNKTFDSYQKYTQGMDAFAAGCTQEDKDYVYDFRGDSNYKPNSPESNGMIWMSKLAAAQCKNRATAKPGAAWKDADCRRYYAEPFRSRYESARALLGSYLLYAKEHEAAVADRPGDGGGTYFTGVSVNYKDPTDVFSAGGPLQFRLGDDFVQNGGLITPGPVGKFLPGFESHWGEPDMGLSQLGGMDGEALKEFVFQRISRAVDRHTNWYASAYDAAPSLPLGTSLHKTTSAAYSPFVASSYEMNQSNNFSQCGFTIPCGNSPPEFTEHKQWMFIFKVKASNWFKPEDIVGGNVKPDLDRVWFDETSFGFDGLADTERAWDRLGSPLEDEHAEILYLWRIPAEN